MQVRRGVFVFAGCALTLVMFVTLFGVRAELPLAAYANTGYEYKSVFVPASVIDSEGESGWKQVDEKEFLRGLQLELNKLGYEGFEVVEVTPILKGRLDTGYVRNGAWGGGFSVTQGAVVLAKRPAQ